MPYSGISDSSLPSNVRKLSANQRRRWLHVYNSEREKGASDGDAIKIANGVVKELEMDEREQKFAPFSDYEAKIDGDTGIVEGYASVFGDRDHGKDRVLPGAFTKTLAARGQEVMYIPSHDYKIHVADIPAVPISIKEDSKGLHTVTKFFLNTQRGKDSFTVIKGYQDAKRPLGLSYTYKPVDYDITKDGRDLKELELYEYGHTALPMLSSARTTSVKADSGYMVHSEEVDHAHSHGDLIHSHPHSHGKFDPGHSYHDHTGDQMKGLEDQSFAMKDGNFVITNVDSLRDAISSISEAKSEEETKQHIIKRAKALNATQFIPEEWGIKSSRILDSIAAAKIEEIFEEFEVRLGKSLDDAAKSKVRSSLSTIQELLGQSTNQEDKKDNSAIKSDIDMLLATIEL